MAKPSGTSCRINGVFVAGEDGQVQFAEPGALTAADFAAVQQQVRARVLRWFARADHLDPADAHDMAGWDHGGGFSLDPSASARAPARTLWAVPLARIFEILPLRCSLCGAQMRLIAFVTDPGPVRAILAHLGEPTTAPRAAPARAPPLWEPMAQPQRDHIPPPALEFVFDQRLGC
jgi:hypothetical protein